MKTKTHRLTPEAKARLQVFIDGASDECLETKRKLLEDWCAKLEVAPTQSACVFIGMRGKIFTLAKDYEQI